MPRGKTLQFAFLLRRSVEAYEESFRRIHRTGISVLGAFIFGMEGDTPEKLARRADYMIHSGVDVMQMTFLTPLPGTRLFERYLQEGRLLYTDFPSDWVHYDMSEVTHHPGSMDPDALAGVADALHRRMYAWPVLVRKAVSTFWQTRDITATKFALGSNVVYRNVSVGLRKSRTQGAQ